MWEGLVKDEVDDSTLRGSFCLQERSLTRAPLSAVNGNKIGVMRHEIPHRYD